MLFTYWVKVSQDALSQPAFGALTFTNRQALSAQLPDLSSKCFLKAMMKKTDPK